MRKNYYTHKGKYLKPLLKIIGGKQRSRDRIYQYAPRYDIYLEPFLGCYDDQTEVMTNKGWKLFKDIELGDTILSLNLENRECQWSEYIKYHEYDYSGDLIHFKGRSVDLMVTPNHNMVGRDQHSTDFELIEAKKLSTYHKFYFPGWGSQKNSKEGIEENLLKKYEFLGFYYGDGWISRKSKNSLVWNFHLKKERKINYFNELMSNLGVEVTKHRTNRDSYVFNFPDSRLEGLAEFIESKKATEKVLPDWVMQSSVEYLRAFLMGFIQSDGCSTYSALYTSSKALADQLQLILRLCGYGSTLKTRIRKESKLKDGRVIYSGKPQYEIYYYVDKAKQFSLKSKKNVFYVPYSGKVYCLTLEKNNIMFVRRNGKTAWCGNSGSVVMGLSKVEKEVVNDINEDIINFYNCVKRCPDPLFAYIEENVKQLKEQGKPFFEKLRDTPPNKQDKLMRAVWLYTINKSAFNGILRYNQKGDCNSSYCKTALGRGWMDRNWLNLVVERIKDVEFICSDYHDFMVNNDQEEAWAVIDSPYILKSKEVPDGTQTIYNGDAFTLEDHINLNNLLKQVECKWLMTINDCEWVREKYEDFNIVSNEVYYSCSQTPNGRGVTKELIIMNY